jgi:hypothetical protein
VFFFGLGDVLSLFVGDNVSTPPPKDGYVNVDTRLGRCAAADGDSSRPLLLLSATATATRDINRDWYVDVDDDDPPSFLSWLVVDVAEAVSSSSILNGVNFRLVGLGCWGCIAAGGGDIVRAGTLAATPTAPFVFGDDNFRFGTSGFVGDSFR